MRVAVVIPNWNGADLIGACLESLKQQAQKPEIIVVDNGSVDSSVAVIEKDFPEVKLLKLVKNAGFSGGVNTGIKYALEHGFEAVALFNNDAVANKDWLKGLVSELKEPKVGIVTGKLMRSDKVHIDSVGEQYSIWGMPFPAARNRPERSQFNESRPVFGATGGASLYRASLLKDIGLFDEKFFAYLEDVDISFRAQLAGWRVMYTPKAVAYHQVGATSSKLGKFVRYHTTKNFFILYTKNMPGVLYFKYLPLFVLYSLRLAASSLFKGHFGTYSKAFCRFLVLLPSVLKDRRTVQQNRKVSVSYIDALLYKDRPPKIPAIN